MMPQKCQKCGIEYSGKFPGFCPKHKGLAFEDQVVEYLKACGLEIIERKFYFEHAEVDISAKSTDPISTHTYFIECKAQERRVGSQSVKKFVESIARPAITEGKANKFMIISFSGFSREAISYAHENLLVELVSFDELRRRLFDHRRYLRNSFKLIASWQTSFLADYVAPCFFDYPHRKARLISSDLLRYLKTRPSKDVFILGDGGMGKSTFCKALFRDLVHCEPDYPSAVPILLKLREFSSVYRQGKTLADYVLEHLRPYLASSHPNLDALSLSGIRFFVILDGFDEMARELDPYTIEDQLGLLTHLKRRLCNATIITTCRKQYVEDKLSFLKDGYRPLVLGDWRVGYEIKTYITQKRGLKKARQARYLELIRTNRNLRDLCRTPLLLGMTLGELKSISRSGSIRGIDRPRLYSMFIESALKVDYARGLRAISIGDKRALLFELALSLYQKESLSISTDELDVLLKRIFAKKILRGQLDYGRILKELVACTFLSREGEYFCFRHKSFLEFILAEKFYNDILEGRTALLADIIVNYSISEMIAEMFKKKSHIEILCNAIKGSTNEARLMSNLVDILGEICGRAKGIADHLLIQLYEQEKRLNVRFLLAFTLGTLGYKRYIVQYLQERRKTIGYRLLDDDLNFGTKLRYYDYSTDVFIDEYKQILDNPKYRYGRIAVCYFLANSDDKSLIPYLKRTYRNPKYAREIREEAGKAVKYLNSL